MGSTAPASDSPASTATLPIHRTAIQWTMDQFRHFRRAFRFAHENALTISYACTECRAPIQLLGTVEAPEFTLRCICTDRIIKRGR